MASGAGAGHGEAVPVRRRLGDRVRADHAAAPGAVLHHHGLAEQNGELLRQHPPDQVVRPAGRERHHEAHRPIGKGAAGRLGLGACRREGGERGAG
jgi:hypothetical protein